MWRAFFMSVGIILCILGAECLVLERVVLVAKVDRSPALAASTSIASPGPYGYAYPSVERNNREIEPPEWAAWSLLSSGAVIMLYAFTLRGQG
jgi:hypothetical protein